jgi:hypothetical protein
MYWLSEFSFGPRMGHVLIVLTADDTTDCLIMCAGGYPWGFNCNIGVINLGCNNKTKSTHQLFYTFTNIPKIFWPSGMLTFLPHSPEMWQTWVLQHIVGIFGPHFSSQEKVFTYLSTCEPTLHFYIRLQLLLILQEHEFFEKLGLNKLVWKRK